MHREISVPREIVACVIGGFGSLIAMAESNGFFGAWLITAAKFGIISAIILVAYSPLTAMGFAKHIFLYAVTELLFGGICFMLITVTHSRIIYMKNYTVYFDISLLDIAVCCCGVYLLIILCEKIRNKRIAAENRYRATYNLGKYEITMPAIADTGNMLCDSFTGVPVVIFCCTEMYEHYNLSCPEQMCFYGFRPIPYSTVGSDGLIYITSKGNVKITGGNFSKDVECCVGILPTKDNPHAIFNPTLLI
jgi:stage II sporulation protein GA (sporulation sigma-E factor processing peptidase)